MRKLLCVATICAVCAPVAFSRNNSAANHGERSAARMTAKKGMSQEDAEMMARRVFGEDIQAEKLTLRQAADYTKCAHEDYGILFMKTPEGKRARKNLKSMQRYDEMNARKKAKLEMEMDQSDKEMRKLQNRSESRCMKKLGLDVPHGKVFGRVRRLNHS